MRTNTTALCSGKIYVYFVYIQHQCDECDGSGNYNNLISGIYHVIIRTRLTGRRSVIAIPLVGPRSLSIDMAVENAVNENIVIVAAAGE